MLTCCFRRSGQHLVDDCGIAILRRIDYRGWSDSSTHQALGSFLSIFSSAMRMRGSSSSG